MKKYTEILQRNTIGIRGDESQWDVNNNIKECPGFSWEDSIKWIQGNNPEKYKPLADEIKKSFSSVKSILELGCGPGCLGYFLRSHSIDYVSLDINADTPLVSPYIDKNNHFICYTDRPYQIKENYPECDINSTFDLIISYEHFEHIPPARLEIFLNNIKKHCHEDTIINATCSTAKTTGKILDKLDNFEELPNENLYFASHQSVHNKEEWIQILNKHGFEIIDKTIINSNNTPPNFSLENTVEVTFKLKTNE